MKQTINQLINRKQELEILIEHYQETKQYCKANELILEYKELLKEINNYKE